jgi:hypothetical protein
MNLFNNLFKPVIIEEDDIIIPPPPVPSVVKQVKKKIVFVEDEDDLDYDIALKLLKDPVYTIKNKTLHIVSLSKLKHLNLNPYRHQREYNPDHVEVLKEGINKTGYLYHPIILCHVPDRKEITIIDGQHRFKALKSMVGIKNSDDIMIQFEVISTDDDDIKIMDVYRNVNTCQPIDMNKIVLEQDYVKIIQKLKNMYKKKVINEYKKSSKHYIIESKLKAELMNRNLLIKYSSEVLINKIQDINSELEEKMLILNRLSEDEMAKCKKTGFWLGTDFPNWVNKL